MGNWKIITNHGLVLATIAKGEGKTAREISDEVGITEATTHHIIMDLENEGYIKINKIGNRNYYIICKEVQIKAFDATVGELLDLLVWRKNRENDIIKETT